MIVKCKECGNKIDRDTAFKIRLRDQNNYFCSESEYKNRLIRTQSVKCSFCGKTILKGAAYVLHKEGHNQYYCSEDEYISKCIFKEKREKLDTLFKQLIGEPIPYGTIRQKIGGWFEGNRIITLHEYIEYDFEYLQNALSLKQFANLSNKTAYLCAVIGNRILNYRMKTKPIIMQTNMSDEYVHEDRDIDEPKFIPITGNKKKKPKRIGFAELEEMYDGQ